MRDRYISAITALLVLAGCTPIEPPSSASTVPETVPANNEDAAYKAFGTEPFWDLELGPTTTIFNDANVEGVRKFATPSPRPSFNGIRYVSDEITIDVTHSLCSDGMSDREYDHRVTVTVDGAIFRGCGQPRSHPASLANSRWEVVQIDGKPTIPSRTDDEGRENYPHIGFGKISVFAHAGCNRFFGEYEYRGATLTINGLASTRKMCTGPSYDQEVIIAYILNGSRPLKFGNEGDLTLTKGKHSMTLISGGECTDCK